MNKVLSFLGRALTFALSAWPLWVPALVVTAGTFPIGLQLIVLALAVLGAGANGLVYFVTTTLYDEEKATPAILERANDLVGHPPATYWRRALRLGLIWGVGTALMIFAVPDTGWLTGFSALFMFLSTALGIGHCSTSATISTQRRAAEEG